MARDRRASFFTRIWRLIRDWVIPIVLAGVVGFVFVALAVYVAGAGQDTAYLAGSIAAFVAGLFALLIRRFRQWLSKNADIPVDFPDV